MDPVHSFIASMGDYLEMRGFSLRPKVGYEAEEQVGMQGERKRPPFEEIGERLARFHRASAGFPFSRRHPLNRLGKWKEIWIGRLKRIGTFRDSLFQAGVGHPFDTLFLTHYTYFSQLGQVALFYLDDALYPHVVQSSASYGILSYRSLSLEDVQPKGKTIWFMNEHDWRIDIPVRDIASLIRNTMMQNGDVDEAHLFLNGYGRIRALLPEEYPLLYAVFLYPVEWVEMVEAYFTRQLPAEEGLMRFRQLIHTEKVKNHFIHRFSERLRETEGIDLTEVAWLRPTDQRRYNAESTNGSDQA